MSRFEIQIASVPDRENLVAEIWFGKHHIAEINKETESLNIEFFDVQKSIFKLDDFLEALETAKSKLLQ